MSTFKKLLAYAGNRKILLALSLIVSVFAAICQFVPLYYILLVLRGVIEGGRVETPLHYALMAVLFLVVATLLTFIGLLFSHLAAFRVETNMRKIGVTRMLRASFSFFDKNQSGRVRKTIDNNATDTHTLVAHWLPDFAQALVSPIVLLVLFFVIDWRFGLATLVILLLSVFAIIKMMGEVKYMNKYMDALEGMNNEAVEYVRGMQVVKIFKATVLSFRNFHQAIKNHASFALNYAFTARKPYVMNSVLLSSFFLFFIPLSIALITGGNDAKTILVTAVFYMIISAQIGFALSKIMYIGETYMMASQAVERLDKLFVGADEHLVLSTGDEEMTDYSIEFDGVSFSYSEEAEVLHNLSFKLESGKQYALVGPSGGGKSTVAKLIASYYAVSDGAIRIGGKPIESYSKETRMKNIAFVFQNAKLFKTTLYENVQMGRPEATREEVMSAFRDARCMDIIEKFPDKENTMIGKEGVFLSGGETQRIAIARCILKNAPIVILDEASAAADPENEYEIMQAFSNLMKDKTVIMIAHRLSSIRHVDEVLVFDEGQLIERGTHEALLARGGRYRSLQEAYQKSSEWRVHD